MASWVNSIGVGEVAGGKLLGLMTNEEFGVREPTDLLELEDINVEELKASLPMAQRNKFMQAVENLKVRTCVCNMHVSIWSRVWASQSDKVDA